MRTVLILLSTFCLVSFALLNGNDDEWSRYAHVVKILARASSSSAPVACTGTLISPRLILTAAHCVIGEGADSKLSEILVSLTRPAKPALRKRASLLQVNGTVAVLSLVHPLHTMEICPGGVPADRVASLTVTPSLTQSPVHAFEWDKIDSTTCRIVAFKSVEKVAEFLSSTSIESAVMSVEVGPDSLTMRRTHASMPAPCFEDAGAPFECLVGEKFIQVGLFSSLVAVDDGEEHRHKREDKVVSGGNSTTGAPSPSTAAPSPSTASNATKTTTTTTPVPTNAPKDVFARCRSASLLRFARLSSSLVASIIEKHDFTAFVRMHEACGGAGN